MSTPTTIEILRGAKALIQTQGWHQGWFFKDNDPSADPAKCPVCLRGAFSLAAGAHHPADWSLVPHEVYRAVNAVLPDTWRGLIAGWTVAEVYALLDAAIERAEAGEWS
jgi:hypothetical protein